ncbi:Periplasmic thiol:disulfide interchange protein DsbA [invertebrate metagenome]|uniref:Periplasmic thiol:disulfide interchange protein DsbA n=1 Tax=invertebrate metagenome TaxID=1711999 RepID=A0A484H506_9ZZZZ
MKVLLRFLTRGGLVVTLFLVLVGVMAEDTSHRTTPAAQAATPAAQAARLPADRFMGREDASVTVIDYSSLTCPHCADFHTQILPRFKTHYIDSGKVKFIYRDFAVDPVATAGAMLARCAPLDMYFHFLGTLFSSQKTWSRASQPRRALVHLAQMGGMTETEVNQCLSDPALLADLNAIKNEAIGMHGITATPSFVIGGRTYVGIASYEALVSLVERELNK